MWFAVVPGTISISMLIISAWVTSVYRKYRVTVVKAWVERKEDSEDDSDDDESDGKSYFTVMRERLNSVFKRKKLKTKKERDFLVLDKRFVMPPHFPIITMPEIGNSEIYPKDKVTYLKKSNPDEDTEDEKSTKGRFTFVRRRKGKFNVKKNVPKDNSQKSKAVIRKLPSNIVIEPPSSFADPSANVVDFKSESEDEHLQDNNTNGIVRVSSAEPDPKEDHEADKGYSAENEFNLQENFLHPAPVAKGDALNSLLPPIDHPNKQLNPASSARRHSSFGRVELTSSNEVPSNYNSGYRHSLTAVHDIPPIQLGERSQDDSYPSSTNAIASIKKQFAHGDSIDKDSLMKKLSKIAGDNNNSITQKTSQSLTRSHSYTGLSTIGPDDAKEPVDAMSRFVDQRPRSRPPSIESLNELTDAPYPASSSKNESKKSSFKSIISKKSKSKDWNTVTDNPTKDPKESTAGWTTNSKSATVPDNSATKTSVPVLRSSSEEGTSATVPISKTKAWKTLGLKRNRDDISEKSDHDESEAGPSTETQPRSKYTTAKLLTTMRGISKAFGKVQHKRKMQHFNFRKYIVYLDNFLPTVGYQIGGKIIQRDTIVLYVFFMLSFLALFAQEKLFGQQAQLGGS